MTSAASLAGSSSISVTGGTLTVSGQGTVANRNLSNNLVLGGGVLQAVQDNIGSGGTIYDTGGTVTHVFSSGGTLSLPVAVSGANVLVVGGGGAGGNSGTEASGGGGAGGVVLSLTNTMLAPATGRSSSAAGPARPGKLAVRRPLLCSPVHFLPQGAAAE